MVPDVQGAEAPRTSISTVAAVSVLLVVFFAGAPAAADSDPAADDRSRPALSIVVSDALDTMSEGDESTYKITLRNDGVEVVDDIAVHQTVPVGMELLDYGPDGTRTSAGVSWQSDLKAGEATEYTFRARMGASDGDVWRATVTACATAGAGTRPLVCATDANALPAGAAADARELEGTVPAARWQLATAAAVLVAVIAGSVYVIVWHRVRHGRPPRGTMLRSGGR